MSNDGLRKGPRCNTKFFRDIELEEIPHVFLVSESAQALRCGHIRPSSWMNRASIFEHRVQLDIATRKIFNCPIHRLASLLERQVSALIDKESKDNKTRGELTNEQNIISLKERILHHNSSAIPQRVGLPRRESIGPRQTGACS
jgi:hypothetical protein